MTVFRDYVCSTDNPPSVYIVEPGDSLWRIASRQLNNATRWEEIASYNGLSQPYTIFVGQRLYLPPNQHSTSTLPTNNMTPAEPVASFDPLADLLKNTTDSKPPVNTTSSEKQPAKTVDHAPVTIKLDDNITVLRVDYPGGSAEIGFKGQFVMQRTTPLSISVTRDGLKAEYTSTQKDWATPRFVKLLNSIGIKIDDKGTLTLVGKVGMQTEWYSGEFEFTHDGALKYEVKPKPIDIKIEDLHLKGTIGCWIKLKSRVNFDPSWQLKPIPVLTEQQVRNMLMVTMVGMAGYAATTATAMTFAEYLTLIVTRAAGVASSFIIIPPGVLEEFRRSNGMGNSGPPMI